MFLSFSSLGFHLGNSKINVWGMVLTQWSLQVEYRVIKLPNIPYSLTDILGGVISCNMEHKLQLLQLVPCIVLSCKLNKLQKTMYSTIYLAAGKTITRQVVTVTVL